MPAPRPRARRLAARAWPLVLGLAFAALYAATWNGRWLHDGPFLDRAVAEGRRLHVHVGYLPLAQLVRLALAALPGADPGLAPAVVSVASGGVLVAATAALARRLTGSGAAALATGALAGTSPVVWVAAGMVELHLFAGAAAAGAAWLAVALPGPAPLRALAATLVAVLAHATNALVAPLVLVLALAGPGRPRPRAGTALATVVATALGVALGRAALRAAMTEGTLLEGTLPLLARAAVALLGEPGVLARRLAEEVARPWCLLALAPLGALVPSRVPGAVRATAALTAAGGALLAASYIPLLGQYGLILAPALALGAAGPLARAAGARGGGVALVVVVAAQLALALPERARAAADPDLVWARALVGRVEPPCTVLCRDRKRKLRVEEVVGVPAVDFLPSGDHVPDDHDAVVVAAVERTLGRGVRLYLDPEVLLLEERDSPVAPIARAVRRRLRLEQVPGAPLLRIEGVRPPRRGER